MDALAFQKSLCMQQNQLASKYLIEMEQLYSSKWLDCADVFTDIACAV